MQNTNRKGRDYEERRPLLGKAGWQSYLAGAPTRRPFSAAPCEGTQARAGAADAGALLRLARRVARGAAARLAATVEAMVPGVVAETEDGSWKGVTRLSSALGRVARN